MNKKTKEIVTTKPSPLKSRFYVNVWYYLYCFLYYFSTIMLWILGWPFILLGAFSEDKVDEWRFCRDLHREISEKERK